VKPTLFDIFVYDLIDELQLDFPKLLLIFHLVSSHGFLRDSIPPQGSRWPAPTRPNPTPLPHPRTLPNLLPLSYLITEVLQFEYLGLILDPKLTMYLATTESIRRAAHGQSVTQGVSYSLRYDKKRSQLTPTQNLGLWKSTVLPHFLQNLRYIHSTTDANKFQTSLNLSLVCLCISMMTIQPY